MFDTTVTVVGTVLTQPKFWELPGGDRGASFRVGSTARRFDRATDRWVDGDRVFATVMCRKRLAEGIRDAVDKRSPVIVTGRLRTREYEVSGQWRTAVEIEASALGVDVARTASLSRTTEGTSPPTETAPSKAQPPAYAAPGDG